MSRRGGGETACLMRAKERGGGREDAKDALFFNASDSCPSMKSSFCLLSDTLPSTQSDTNACFFEPPRFSFRLDFESRALVECPAPLGRRRLVAAEARAKMACVCEPTVGPMEMLGMLAVSSPGCVSEDAEEAGESGSMGEFMTDAYEY